MEHMLERWWIFGGPRDFWVRNADVIKELIARNKLQGIPMQVPSPVTLERGEAGGERALAVRWPPFPGGMKIAHLHFGDQIFTLTDQQWGAFAEQVMKDFESKLGRVHTVTFDQLMGIADAVGPLVG